MASSRSNQTLFQSIRLDARLFVPPPFADPLHLAFADLLNPTVIELGIDTMVMDNDDAKCRHGVKPTYKKKKGFQPLQMNWGRFIVDAVFRSGDKHSNHGDTVLEYDPAHGS